MAATGPVRLADRLRLAMLHAGGRWVRPFVRRRALRVHSHAALLIVASLALASLVPVASLFLTPLLLGVPHLVSDVRTLGPTFRPWQVLRRWGRWAVVGCLVAVGLTHLPAFGAAGLVLAALAAPVPGWTARLGVLSAGAVLAAWSWLDPREMLVALAHGHHAVAVLVWWLLRPRTWRDAWFPVALAVVATLIVGGALDGWLAASRGLVPGMGRAEFLAEWMLTPGWGGDHGRRFVMLYAFGQSIHYGVWLRLIPEDTRQSETPRTFRRSLQVLEQALGRPLVWGAALLSLVVAGWGLWNWWQAWEVYMRLAVFHAWLELAALGLWALAAAGPRGAQQAVRS
jgi:hypothetical protein